jgi:pimeloyl-ACP methyl ester carboxylesterase
VSEAGMPILFLAGTTPDAALAKTYRVIAPPLAGATPASLAAEITGGALVVAEGDAAPLACRLALDHAELVKNLVLSAPAPADAALLARLGEIKAPCLLLLGSNAPAPLQEAMAAYQQRLQRATRILFYGAAHDLTREPAWTRLVCDFFDRGERFVVNLGGEP